MLRTLHYRLPSFRFYDDDDAGGSGSVSDEMLKKIRDQVAAELRTELKKEFDQAIASEREQREALEDVLIQAAGGEEAVEHFMRTGELPEGYDAAEDDDDDYEDQRMTRSRGREDYFDDDDDDDDDFGVQGAEDVRALVKGLRTRYEKRIDALENKLQQQEEAAREQYVRNLIAERDKQLADALMKNEVVDLDAGLKLMRDHMEFDEEEGEWRFKNKEGLYMDTEAGIAETLPDYMRKPMGGEGGSGSGGPRASRRAVESQIESKRKEVSDLQKKAQQSGDTHDISAWQRGNRELQQLSAQVGNKGVRPDQQTAGAPAQQ